MYVSLNNDNVIEAASKQPLNLRGRKTLEVPELRAQSESGLLGKRLVVGPAKSMAELRIALICNWGDRCGIATYTEFLVNALRPKVKEIRMFAEHVKDAKEEENVVRCWRRGESMVNTMKQVLAWEPDLVFIQHEFGIFPKATHFLKMIEMLDHTPYVMTFHSVYEHLDKTVCTSYIRNLITHSEQGRESLHRCGHNNDVFVVPHGCVVYKDHDALWNIFQNEHTVIQFGFGFEYKGVDMAVEAIRILKETNPKFQDIFYCYMCSESNHTRLLQEKYYAQIREQVRRSGLEDNVVVLRGYLTEQHLCNFMRTAKLAIFPYKNNPNNVVYAASGAIRKALANGTPTIASDSHLFDDLEGILPRPATAEDLAREIELAFTNETHRQDLSRKGLKFVTDHTWDSVADKHIEVFQKIIDKANMSVVRIENVPNGA
jgi:glycosyltransferase involved in cell wall biosynthesis